MKNQEKAIKELALHAAERIRQQAKSPRECTELARKLFDEITGLLLQNAPETGHISAPNSVVEVMDAKSGHLYRRYLELEYEETGNGLRLMGDDIGAKPVQIVFLSNTAIEKMHDLQGLGPDDPVCG